MSRDRNFGQVKTGGPRVHLHNLVEAVDVWTGIILYESDGGRILSAGLPLVQLCNLIELDV